MLIAAVRFDVVTELLTLDLVNKREKFKSEARD